MFNWAPVPEGAFRRAREVQEILTEHGEHRPAGPVDLIVAAVAELSGLPLLHHDADFETVARRTEPRTRWLAEPGTA